MRWPSRERRETGIAFAGILLLLVLMAWISVSVVEAREVSSGRTALSTLTVQTTPTEDATVTALNKEKLAQEVAQQQHTWENWLWNNAAAISSTFLIVLGALFGLWRWFGDRGNERKKRAEEHFQKVVEGLGGDNEGAKVGAAILLRTFLGPGYEQFYRQAFDLAVAHLRLRKVDPITAEPLDSLSQALITIFKESFLKVRPRLIWGSVTLIDETWTAEQQLNAAHIQLDTAYLNNADLRYAWMLQAYLREADLQRADLRHATLRQADLSRADLIRANLYEANLSQANLSQANLSQADLRGADLIGASLDGADLSFANLGAAHLIDANLSGANLRGADLRPKATYNEGPLIFTKTTHVIISHLKGAILYKANLSGANLSGAKLEDARSLEDTDLRRVSGLTQEQLAICKARGAIIDENTMTSSPQPPVSSPLTSQSNDAQAQAATSAQESTPTPDLGPKTTLSNGGSAESND